MEYGIATVSEKGFFARIIQLFTWSKWNHVVLYINTTWYKDVIVEMNDEGIQMYDFKSYCKGRNIRIHKNTPKLDTRKALHFIFKNKEKKYDYLKTLFFFFKSKDVNSKDKWNCVEFIEAIFKDQDVILFNGEKLTPGQINKRLSSEEDLIFIDR